MLVGVGAAMIPPLSVASVALAEVGLSSSAEVLVGAGISDAVEPEAVSSCRLRMPAIGLGRESKTMSFSHDSSTGRLISKRGWSKAVAGKEKVKRRTSERRMVTQLWPIGGRRRPGGGRIDAILRFGGDCI